VSKSAEEASFAVRASLSEIQLSLVNFFRGNWADAFLHAQASCPAEPGNSIEEAGQGTLFRQMAYAVIATARSQSLMRSARFCLERQTEQPRFGRMLALVIEGLVMLGERSQAAQLYSLACELVGNRSGNALGHLALPPRRSRVSALQQHITGKPPNPLSDRLATGGVISLPSRTSRDTPLPSAMMLIDRRSSRRSRKGANASSRSAGELPAYRNAASRRFDADPC